MTKSSLLLMTLETLEKAYGTLLSKNDIIGLYTKHVFEHLQKGGKITKKTYDELSSLNQFAIEKQYLVHGDLVVMDEQEFEERGVQAGDVITEYGGNWYYYGGYNMQGWHLVYTDNENFHVNGEKEVLPTLKDCIRIHKNHYE